MAVTSPLAGVSTSIRRPFRTWLTGWRFDTTNRGSPRWRFTNCLSRSSVHTVSPLTRSAASCSAAARARDRLLAMPDTCWARGPNIPGSGRVGGGARSPVRSARVHSAMRASGWVTHARTTSSAMAESKAARTTARMALARHISHSAAWRSDASRKTASAPTTRSSRWSGVA